MISDSEIKEFQKRISRKWATIARLIKEIDKLEAKVPKEK